EYPKYVPTIISCPRTFSKIQEYPKPRGKQNTTASKIATQKPKNPKSPNCILISAPNNPPIIPIGKPKFGPIPDLIVGTIANTNTPFIPILLSESPIKGGTATPVMNASTNSPIKNNTIIKVGTSIFFRNVSLSFINYHLL